MAFSIKDPEVDKNLRLLCSMTGESLTDAVSKAISDRMEKLSIEKEEARLKRNANMRKVLSKLKPVNIKDGYDHKKVTDELWGM